MKIDEVHVMHAINTLIVFCLGASGIGSFVEIPLFLICSFFLAIILDFFLFPVEIPLICAGFAIYRHYKQRKNAAPQHQH